MEIVAYRYLQLNKEHTLVLGESLLTGKIDHPDMVYDPECRGKIGWGYDEENDRFFETSHICYDIVLTSISQDGSELTSVRPNMYYVIEGEITLKADCEFSGNINTSLSTPTLKTPLVRYANNLPTADEVYGTVSIESGKLTGKFNLPRSGDWRIEANRISKALEFFGEDWKVSFEDIHLIV